MPNDDDRIHLFFLTDIVYTVIDHDDTVDAATITTAVT